MLNYALQSIVISAVLNLILTLLIILISKKINLISRKKTLSFDGRCLPVFGGIAIFISFYVTLVYFLLTGVVHIYEIRFLITSIPIIVFFGLIDDVVELPIFIKFFGQLVAASVLIFFDVRTKVIFISYYLNVLLSILWFVGITNALNFLDIMDGLSSGVAFISALSLLALGLLSHNMLTVLVLSSLIGILISFLIFNFPPAKIFMGDSGSMFLGFTLAVCAILTDYATEKNPITLLAPLLALGFPIFDIVFVVLSRLKSKRSIFRKSNDHFTLKLVSMGYDSRRAVFLAYLFSLFFSIASLIVCLASNPVALATILIVLIISSIVGLKIITIRPKNV